VTLAAGIVAIAVCADVAVQYSLPGGGSFDTVSLAPPLAPLPPRLTAGKVDVTLVARAAASTTACLLVAILPDGKVQGGWRLTRASSSTGLVNGSATPVPLCTFALTAPSFALQLPHFAAPEPATVRFTLGSDLQLVRWTVSVADAKEGAVTTARPSADVRGWWGVVAASDAPARNLTVDEASTTLVPTSIRAHTVGVRLLRAAFVDRTYFTIAGGAGAADDDDDSAVAGGGGVGGATSYGHRASFLSYAVEDNSLVSSAPGLPALRGDTLLLSFSLADLVSTTVRVPRFGILPLLGVIGGLALAVAAAFKLAYEYADACCSCTRVERERVKARLLRGEKVDLAPAPRGKLLVASSPSTAFHDVQPPSLFSGAATQQQHGGGPLDANIRNPLHQAATPIGARFRQSLRLLAYAPVAVGGAASSSSGAGGDAGGGGGKGGAVPVLGSRTAPLIPGSSLNASAQAISPEVLPETTNPYFRKAGGGEEGAGLGAGTTAAAATAATTAAKRPPSGKAPPPGTKKAAPVFSIDDNGAASVTTPVVAAAADVGLEETAAGV
jgi:hypothetical protein